MSPLRLLCVILVLVPAAAGSAAGADVCDPAFTSCVRDGSSGTANCPTSGTSAAGWNGFATNTVLLQAGAGGWTHCSYDGSGRSQTHAVGAAASTLGATVDARWETTQAPSGSGRKVVLTWHHNDAGEGRVEWTRWQSMCYTHASARPPLFAYAQGLYEGCPAGAPPAPPVVPWGRMLP